MTEQRQQFVLYDIGSTQELVAALNMILTQLTDRLDMIEGLRGESSIRTTGLYDKGGKTFTYAWEENE